MTVEKSRRRKGCNEKSDLIRNASLYSLIILTLLMLSQVAYCDRAPDFTLTDIDGNTFSLSDFEGSIVILNFFTSRCSACVYEIKHLKTVRAEFGEELVMISLSIAPDYDTDERLRDFREQENINWTLARDIGRNVYDSYEVPRIPMVFVIDKWRCIAFEHLDWVDASDLIEEIDELLAKTTDLNLDGKVDETDATIIAAAFGSEVESKDYEEKMDFDNNGKIDMHDIAKVAIDIRQS